MRSFKLLTIVLCLVMTSAVWAQSQSGHSVTDPGQGGTTDPGQGGTTDPGGVPPPNNSIRRYARPLLRKNQPPNATPQAPAPVPPSAPSGGTSNGTNTNATDTRH
jgi:hypothetical protein